MKKFKHGLIWGILIGMLLSIWLNCILNIYDKQISKLICNECIILKEKIKYLEMVIKEDNWQLNFDNDFIDLQSKFIKILLKESK